MSWDYVFDDWGIFGKRLVVLVLLDFVPLHFCHKKNIWYGILKYISFLEEL